MKTLLFMHIPKCGGTTLRTILRSWFEPTEAIAVSTESPQTITTFKQREDYDSIRLIYGHFKYSENIHDYIPDSSYFTLVRDPIERAISTYFYVKQTPAHRLHEAAQNLSVEDFYEECLRPARNCMTNFISGVSYELDSTPESLHIAKEHIENKFLVVGTVEQFDQSILLLRRKLEKPIPVYRRENLSQKDFDFSDSLKSRIREDNEYDYALYDYVNQRLHEQILAEENFDTEVSALKIAQTYFADLILDLRHSNAELKKENLSHVRDLHVLRAQNKSIRVNNEQLNSKLSQSTSKIHDLTDTVLKLKTHSGSLKERIKKRKKAIRRQKKQLKARQADVSRLRRKLDKHVQILKDLQNEIEAIQSSRLWKTKSFLARIKAAIKRS